LPLSASDRATLVSEGEAYEHGEGVRKDPARAAELYCAAARHLDADATYNLAWMFAYGRGVARNDAYAAGLFGLAGGLGRAPGESTLALFRNVSPELPPCMSEVAPVAAMAQPEYPKLERSLPGVFDPFDSLPPWKREIAAIVYDLAPRYSIDARFALAVIATESNFDRDALSPKGAMGLMQLLPETASRFAAKNAYDIRQNLRGGLAYLRWLLAYYQGQVSLAAAAYNAGEAVVDKHRGIPPYPETRDYVRRVLRLYGNETHPYESGLVDPSPILAPDRNSTR